MKKEGGEKAIRNQLSLPCLQPAGRSPCQASIEASDKKTSKSAKQPALKINDFDVIVAAWQKTLLSLLVDDEQL